jgi:hypothetical protein
MSTINKEEGIAGHAVHHSVLFLHISVARNLLGTGQPVSPTDRDLVDSAERRGEAWRAAQENWMLGFGSSVKPGNGRSFPV